MSKPAKFVTRAGWKARTRGATPKTHPIGSTKGVTLHWEGPRMGTFLHARCAAKVRGIEEFHRDGRGWADIAYNALVCPHGYVFEGRGVNTKSAANGNGPDNDDWYAVCYLGGQGDGFTTKAKSAFVEAVQWLRSEGNAGPRVNGHRDHKSTACPGDEIYRWLHTADFDPPKPKPKPGIWKTPIDKKLAGRSLTLQTATANVRELPRHDDTIGATFKAAATGCQVVGFQETGNKVYVAAAQKVLQNHRVHGLTGDGQHNVSIGFDKALFRHVASGYRKLYDGEDGISHTRHALWVEVEMIEDPKRHLIFVSTHLPAGGFDPTGAQRTSGDRIAKRVSMWTVAVANEVKLLTELAAKGHPMIVFSDANRRKVNRLPAKIAGRATRSISSALDWTTYIDGDKETWTVHEANKIAIGSDHPALQNRASLRFS